jgi:hypothetical protein
MDHVITAKGLAHSQAVMVQAVGDCLKNLLCNVKHLVLIDVDMVCILFI